MRLLLIRHYKTEFNASGHIMGWGDSPKVANWLEDMEYLEGVLASHAAQPDLIYSSALGRARHTADYFATSLDVSTVRQSPQLNEINYGALYRKPKAWVAQHYPQHKRDTDFVYPDGESFSQMQRRCVTFVLDLAAAAAGQTVLCVAHAGVIRALVSHFLGLDYRVQLRRKVCHRYVGVMGFAGGDCVSYDEWGLCSGFVSDGELALPYCPATA